MVVSKVVQLAPLRKQRNKTAPSSKRVFYLGAHSYIGMPGLSWSTEYWVKRLGKGEHWELHCDSEEDQGSELYAGTYTPDELRDYFDSVGFYMLEDRWALIGLGRSAEVLSIAGEEEDE